MAYYKQVDIAILPIFIPSSTPGTSAIVLKRCLMCLKILILFEENLPLTDNTEPAWGGGGGKKIKFLV